MRERIMKKNYAKAFKTVIIIAIVLALVSAVTIPLSLSRQINEISALEQTGREQTVQWDDKFEQHHIDHEELLKSRITPLTTVNYAIFGVLAVMWMVLGIYYWLLIVAWLYRNALKEGMNKSLWPILGLFTNLLAVFAFLIIRDNPHRIKTVNVK